MPRNNTLLTESQKKIVSRELEPQVKALAKEKGITLVELAKDIGISYGCLKHWMEGNVPPNRYQIVSDVFGVSVPELLAGNVFDLWCAGAFGIKDADFVEELKKDCTKYILGQVALRRERLNNGNDNEKE